LSDPSTATVGSCSCAADDGAAPDDDPVAGANRPIGSAEVGNDVAVDVAVAAGGSSDSVPGVVADVADLKLVDGHAAADDDADPQPKVHAGDYSVAIAFGDAAMAFARGNFLALRRHLDCSELPVPYPGIWRKSCVRSLSRLSKCHSSSRVHQFEGPRANRCRCCHCRRSPKTTTMKKTTPRSRHHLYSVDLLLLD